MNGAALVASAGVLVSWFGGEGRLLWSFKASPAFAAMMIRGLRLHGTATYGICLSRWLSLMLCFSLRWPRSFVTGSRSVRKPRARVWTSLRLANGLLEDLLCWKQKDLDVEGGLRCSPEGASDDLGRSILDRFDGLDRLCVSDVVPRGAAV